MNFQILDLSKNTISGSARPGSLAFSILEGSWSLLTFYKDWNFCVHWVMEVGHQGSVRVRMEDAKEFTGTAETSIS